MPYSIFRPDRVDTGYGREWFQSSTAQVLKSISERVDSETDSENTESVEDSWLHDQLREFVTNHLVQCDSMDEAPNYGRLLHAFGGFVGDGYARDVLKATMTEYGFVPQRYHAENGYGHHTSRRIFCLYTEGFDGPVGVRHPGA